MNLKSKTFSLLAAAALSLTMFGGALAQSSDAENVSTVLTGNTANLCAVDIQTWGGGFGAWQYDGTGYNETSGIRTQTFAALHYDSSGNPCNNLSIAFGGLSGPGGQIGLENFSAYSWNWDGVVGAEGHTVDNASYWGNYWVFDYQLNSVPSTLTEGTYAGYIKATVSNGA